MRTVIGSQRGTKRPRFFHGRLLTARDFELEQQYVDGQLRRLARAALGVGIVEGLVVSTSDDTIVISPGLALDSLGRLIELTEPCTTTLPAPAGAWDVFVEVGQEPCDAVPVVCPDENAAQEATMLCDVIHVWLAHPATEATAEGSAVWLGRVVADRGAIEVRCAKPRPTVRAGG